MELYAFPTGIFTQLGSRFLLKGVNWFGCETSAFTPHGLWSTSVDYLLNFMQKEKFNAIRMTMSTDFMLNMDKQMPTTIDYNKNPDLKGKTTGQVMDIIVKKCKERGIKIMPNMYRFESEGLIPDLWYNSAYPETRIIEAWKHIVSRYKNETTVFAVDLKNEPHGRATWGDNNIKTDWAMASERIGNAILEINPKLLIFVGGIAQTKHGRKSWWGGVLDKVRERPVILNIKNKLVYSPHVYGPSVHKMSIFNDKTFPSNLPKIWDEEFGYIQKERLASMVVGEWGGMMTTDNKDDIWHYAFAKYLIKNKLDSFYWCLNPNSIDTKGLVDDDWQTPIKKKVQLLSLVHPNPTILDLSKIGYVPLPFQTND